MRVTKDQLNNCLENLSLTDNQRKVYLYLFKEHKATVMEISKVTGLNRTTIYNIVEQLVNDELLHKESPKFGAKIIFSHPTKLVSFAKEKLSKYEDSTKQLSELMPELIANFKDLKLETRISQFEGIEGVKKMYNDVLETFENNPELKRDSLIGCSNLNKVIRNLPVRWSNQARKRQSELKITSRYLVPEDDNWRQYIKEKYLMPGLKYHPRFKNLPKNLMQIDTEISVYANKVSFISLKEEEPIAVIIESKVFSDSLKILLETLWGLIK